MDFLNVSIIGNTVREATIRKGEKGDFAILDVAVKTRKGNSLYFSTFISGKLMEIVKDIQKGTPVFVEGSFEVEEYTPEGKEKRFNLNVSADNFRILGKKPAEIEEEVDVEQAAKEILGAEEEKAE
jgi:single-stranded DNA-binding protein